MIAFYAVRDVCRRFDGFSKGVLSMSCAVFDIFRRIPFQHKKTTCLSLFVPVPWFVVCGHFLVSGGFGFGSGEFVYVNV